MSSSLLLPNPCLLGIIFTIATHDGNHMVFHYPPKPNGFGFQATPLDINEVHNEVEGLLVSSDSDISYDDGDDNELDDGDFGDEEDEALESNSDESLYSSDVRDDGFESSDMACSEGKSSRSLSGESYIQSGSAGTNNRTSWSSNNRYQSGRDLLEMLYDLDQRKKKRKQIARKRNRKKTREGSTKKEQEIQSLKSSLKTSKSYIESDTLKKKEYRIHKLFSFDTEFLSDLATPPKALCNTRFELTVEDMVFLGLPIHINDDGNWRVSKKSTRSRSKSTSTNQKSRKHSIHDIKLSGHSPIMSKKSELDGKDQPKESATDLDVLVYDGEKTVEKNHMYQFNMLFVLNPPVVEYNHRIDEMFHYIVSRVSLLLRYEQQKTNYVWIESQKILKLREELVNLPIKQQWKSIIEKSSLAKVIADTYKAVSKSEIVNIEINGKLNSFQIPIKKEFIRLPPSYLELPENSSLSSISPFNQLNSFESSTSLDHSNDIMGYFALILLDDCERVIRDIKAEKDSLIAGFIRMIKPNESLQRLSILSGLDAQEVRMFANHLVYWRRAIAILPLTSRNTYICSPISPLKNIHRDSESFNQIFPNLPSLPSFLSMISEVSKNKPKPISNIIPSRDHRDLYMDAIAWLLKKGYVIQLFTFLYLKISKGIKIQVAEEIEIEIKKKQEFKKKSLLLSNSNDESLDHLEQNDITKKKQRSSVSNDDIDATLDDLVEGLNSSSLRIETEKDKEGSSVMELDNVSVQDMENKSGYESFGNRRTDNSTEIDGISETKNVSDNSSKMPGPDNNGSKARTSSLNYAADNYAGRMINYSGSKKESELDLDNANSSLESNGYYNMYGTQRKIQFEEEEEEDTVLLEPEVCSALERRWIAKLVEGQPTEIVNLFYKVLKHMNGRNAAEVFLMQENISRHDFKKLLDALGESIVSVRHW